MGPKEEIKTPEALANWNALEKTSVTLMQAMDSNALESQINRKCRYNNRRDFWNWYSRKIREPESTAIDLINRSGAL